MAKLESAFEGTLTPDQQREILELAERLKESRANHLSLSELEVAAAESGLEPTYLREAVALLQGKNKRAVPLEILGLSQLQWILIAVLIPLHLLLYAMSYGQSGEFLAYAVLAGAGLFGLTSGRSWTSAVRALLFTSIITFGSFIAARMWNQINPSHFDYVAWQDVKQLLMYQGVAVVVGLVLSQFFREVATQKQSSEQISPK